MDASLPERPAPWLQRALLWSSNAALYSFLWPTDRTARVRWVEPHDELLKTVRAGRKLVYVALHRYGYALYLAFGRHVPRELRPAVIGHDGPLSRCQSRAGAWMGYPIVEFQRNAASSPRAQIARALSKATMPLALLPDSGGPYGVMKPGILDIARRADACIVPIAVAAKGQVELGATLRHVFPLPGCALDVLRGPVLEARKVELEACQAALDALEQRVADAS